MKRLDAITSASVLTPGFSSIIFELIKGEMQYVRDLENIDIVSVAAHPPYRI